MDYIDVLKSAATAVWRHKILWLFGFFVGTSSSVPNFNWSTGSGDRERYGYQWRTAPGELGDFGRYVADLVETGAWVWVVVWIAIVLLLVSLVFFVIRVAAEGGLIHLGQRALAGGEVRGGEGWRAGFGHWGRVFGVVFLLALPFVVVLAIMAAAGVVLFLQVFVAVQDGAETLGPTLALVPLGLLSLTLLLIPLGVIFGVLRQLALRHVVLGGMRVWGSLRAGWRDLWGKRGAWGMWLAQLLAGLVFGVVVGAVALIGVGVVLFAGGVFVATGDAGSALPWIAILCFVALVLAVVAVVVGSAFSAFRSTAWTEFYRRMTAAAPVVTPEQPAPPVAPV